MSQLQSLRKYNVLSHTLNTKRKFKKIKSSKQKIQSTIFKQKVNKSYKIWKLLKKLNAACTNLFLVDRKFHSCDLLVGGWSVLRQSWFQFSISIWFHRSWCSISKSKELMFFLWKFYCLLQHFQMKRNYVFWKFQSLQCLPGSWSPPWQLLLQLRKSRLETSRHFIMR